MRGNMREAKGILIVFEGLSCSGKTSSLKEFAKKIKKGGQDVIVVKWNSVNIIRSITFLLERLNLLTPTCYSILQWKSFLYTYYTKVYPNLKKGKIILADRYIYTAFTRDMMNGIDKEFTYKLYQFSKKPDVIFFFTVSPEICAERAKKDGKKIFHLCNRIKKADHLNDKELQYLRGLYNNYNSLFEDAKVTENVKLVKIGQDWNGEIQDIASRFGDAIPINFVEEMNEDCLKSI